MAIGSIVRYKNHVAPIFRVINIDKTGVVELNSLEGGTEYALRDNLVLATTREMFSYYYKLCSSDINNDPCL